MAGFVIMPTDRVAVSTVSIVTGTAVTGYPIQNIQDADIWKKAKITTSAGAARIKIVMPAAPASSSVTDWIISGFFMGNHNADGAAVTVVRHTADVYASGTAALAATTYDASMGQPWSLRTFAGVAYEYWWIDFTGAPSVLEIGKISLGPTFDLGYPEEAYPIQIAPQSNSMPTGRGYPVSGKTDDAVVSYSLRFPDPSVLTSSVGWDPGVTTSTTFPTYNTLERHLMQDRQHVISSASTYSGYSAAGGARPIPFTRGDAYGVSSAGRPAFYGHWDCTIAPFAPRGAVLVANVTEQPPLGPRIKPPTN